LASSYWPLIGSADPAKNMDSAVNESWSLTRRERLRNETRPAHMRLDALVTAHNFFSSVERYGAWLQHSYGFHEHLEAALESAGVGGLLADWDDRRKTGLIKHDLADLGLELQNHTHKSELALADHIECLGALYVMEGASMGARVLLIAAHRLGLSDQHGARHLSTAASSMHSWRSFVAMMEATHCTPADEDRMIGAARRTFDLATACFAGPSLQNRSTVEAN
jgi:heme oxygenase (biliverdin-IX-beta and delta-forming)